MMLADPPGGNTSIGLNDSPLRTQRSTNFTGQAVPEGPGQNPVSISNYGFGGGSQTAPGTHNVPTFPLRCCYPSSANLPTANTFSPLYGYNAESPSTTCPPFFPASATQPRPYSYPVAGTLAFPGHSNASANPLQLYATGYVGFTPAHARPPPTSMFYAPPQKNQFEQTGMAAENVEQQESLNFRNSDAFKSSRSNTLPEANTEIEKKTNGNMPVKPNKENANVQGCAHSHHTWMKGSPSRFVPLEKADSASAQRLAPHKCVHTASELQSYGVRGEQHWPCMHLLPQCVPNQRPLIPAAYSEDDNESSETCSVASSASDTKDSSSTDGSNTYRTSPVNFQALKRLAVFQADVIDEVIASTAREVGLSRTEHAGLKMDLFRNYIRTYDSLRDSIHNQQLQCIVHPILAEVIAKNVVNMEDYVTAEQKQDAPAMIPNVPQFRHGALFLNRVVLTGGTEGKIIHTYALDVSKTSTVNCLIKKVAQILETTPSFVRVTFNHESLERYTYSTLESLGIADGSALDVYVLTDTEEKKLSASALSTYTSVTVPPNIATAVALFRKKTATHRGIFSPFAEARLQRYKGGRQYRSCSCPRAQISAPCGEKTSEVESDESPSDAEVVPTMAAMEQLAKTYEAQACGCFGNKNCSAKKTKHSTFSKCVCSCVVCNPAVPRPHQLFNAATEKLAAPE